MGLMDQFTSMTPDRKKDLALALASGFSAMSGNPNAAAMQQAIAAQRATLAQRREAAAKSEKAKQIQNETVKWLQARGETDLAQAVAGGFMSGTDAVKEAMSDTTTERKTATDAFGRLRYIDTGEEVFGAQEGDPAYTKEQMGAVESLRDDVRADMKDFGLVQDGWNRISTFYNDPGAVSDYALAVGFAKILDPGSVAREGEVSAVANSGSIAEATRQAIVNALKGQGKLPDNVRQEIAELSRKLYADQAQSAQDKLGKYKATANRMNINFGDIYYGSDVTMPGAIIPVVVPDKFKKQGVTQAQWSAMTPAQRKEFMEG